MKYLTMFSPELVKAEEDQQVAKFLFYVSSKHHKHKKSHDYDASYLSSGNPLQSEKVFFGTPHFPDYVRQS